MPAGRRFALRTAMPSNDAARPRVGVLAGWGQYPLVVSQALSRQGYAVYVLGIKDHADPELSRHCQAFAWCGLGQLGLARRFFRRHGVSQLTMAGKIHKVSLFEPGMLWRHLPDWRGACRFYDFIVSRKMDGKDDTLLSAIVAEFGLDGAHFAPATDFAPELLVNYGLLTRRAPTASEQQDIEFGWQLAKEMGRLDIGQSVCVKKRAVLAVEAIEGTDACIRRAGALCTAGGFTVVKTAKPQQDMRFDVPTIGLGTLEGMLAAGARVLAIEAEKTILLDRDRVIALANREGLAIVALADQGQYAAEPVPAVAGPPPTAVGPQQTEAA